MRLLILFLPLITVNNVASLDLVPHRLRVNVLKPDLEAISNYYDNIDDSLAAYILWPKSITYRVRQAEINNVKSLKIDGTFYIIKCYLLTSAYDGLYYKDSKFYVKANPRALPMEVTSKDNIAYSSPIKKMMTEESFLSIKYFGLKEMIEIAETKYNERKSHYNHVLRKNPVTCLLFSSDHSTFLEYTYRDESGFTEPVKDGEVRVLFRTTGIRPSVINSMLGTALVFDPQNKFSVTARVGALGEDANPRDGIFGVRMESVGFLSRHHDSKIMMFSSTDISAVSANPNSHVVSSSDFVRKVSKVEPRIYDVDPGYDSASMPSFGIFQVNGHILVKKFNYVAAKKALDPQCPFIIEFDTVTSYFLFEWSHQSHKFICSDGLGVWPKGMTSLNYHPSVGITLVYR